MSNTRAREQERMNALAKGLNGCVEDVGIVPLRNSIGVSRVYKAKNHHDDNLSPANYVVTQDIMLVRYMNKDYFMCRI